MSLSSAMNVGVTGLGINAEAITVIGNNISNVNTIGFKEGRTIFSDVLSATIGAGQVGRGGQIQAIQNNFTQSGFENTSNNNDLAIQGDGFFIVQDASGRQYYTRAGAFDFNNQQVFTNPDGLSVMAYGIIPDTGLSDGVLGTIDKSAVSYMTAKSTTAANFVVNLNSASSMPASKPTSTVSLTGDFGSTAVPANTTFNIYDEFGNAHAATVAWGGTSPTYTYSITIAGTQAGTPGSATAPITGSLAFPSVINPPVQTLQFTNGAQSLPLSLDFSSMINSTGAAVAPTAAQDGTAGQATGTVAVSGGAATPTTTAAKATANVPNPAPAAIPNAAITPAGGGDIAVLTPGVIDNIDTTNLRVGMAVTSTTAGLLPANTVITGITGVGPGSQITLSQAANVASLPVTGDPITLTPNVTTTGSAVITGIDTTNVTVGQYIFGAGIPVGTTVLSKTANSVTLSNNATATAAGVAVDQNANHTVNLSPTIYNIDTTNIAVGMGITGAGIPANTTVIAKTANSVTLSNNATATANGVALATTSGTTAGSTTVAGIDTTNIVVGMVVTGTGIPANTVVTAKTANSITLSNAATTTNSDVASFDGSGNAFQFIDTAGAVHYGSLDMTGGNWTATIAGASTPITGTVTAGAAGSTWTQNSKTVTINGVSQTVNFDFSQATSAATAPSIIATGFDITSPSTTSNFSNSVQVFDSQGNAHSMTVYYRKVGANSWDYHAVVPDATAINGMAGNNMVSGNLTFNSNGVLASQTPAGTTSYTFQFGGGVASQAITLDFGAGISTQNATPSLATGNQDGYAAGSLTNTAFDENGYLTGTYTNGKTKRLAQLALARFAAVGGLEKAGNSLFINTLKSGDAQIGSASDFSNKVFTKSLEQSNVDMASQLVNMIKLQRAYSGNSKTITTSDDMMQETLSLKR